MGPILGGVIGAMIGWRWIFWFLCIVSGFCLLLIILTLPETARNLVGNGSDTPSPLLRLPMPRIMGQSTARINETDCEVGRKRGWHVPNPIACLKVLSRKDTFIVVTAGGIIHMAYSCLQASLSTLCIKIYGLGQLEAGLIYLPFGFGSIAMTCVSGKLRSLSHSGYPVLLLLSSLLSPLFLPFLPYPTHAPLLRGATGRILNRDYHITAKSHNLPVDKVRGDNLLTFPVEKARLRSAFIPFGVAAATFVGYGWSLHFHAVRFPLYILPFPFSSPLLSAHLLPLPTSMPSCSFSRLLPTHNPAAFSSLPSRPLPVNPTADVQPLSTSPFPSSSNFCWGFPSKCVSTSITLS